VPQKTEPEIRCQDLIDDLLGHPGVTPPAGQGIRFDANKAGGKAR